MKNFHRFPSKNHFIFLSLLLALGCGNSQDRRVVAKVGSQKILAKDFEDELRQAPPLYSRFLSTDEGKKEFLQMMLKEKMLLEAAGKSGIVRKPEVQARLKEYQEEMKKQAEEFRKNLVLREYLNDLRSGQLKVTDEEINKYYADNKSQFSDPVKVEAAHILTTTEPEAQAALARVKKGEKFEKVAQELSKDPSARRGGQIGEVVRGDLAEFPELETALFNLKAGEISGVIKTKLGYHVVRRGNSTRLPAQTLEAATPNIRRTLEKQKFDAWMEQNKSKYNLWIDDKVVASLGSPAAASTAGEPAGQTPQPGAAAAAQGN